MTVFKRPNGKWVAQVYDPSLGRMRQVGSFDLKRDARIAEAKAMEDRVTTGATIAQFAATWLVDFPRPKPGSNTTYRHQTAAYVEEFGARRMDSITVLEARRWALENKSRYPALRAMWNDARRVGIVTSNPWAGLGIQRPGGRRNLPSGWLSLEEVEQLRDVALHGANLAEGWAPVMAGAITIAAYTGIRPGELFGLRHADVGHDTLEIARSVCSRSRTVGTPKNSFARTVVLPTAAREAIEQIPRDPEHDLVVYSPRGRQFWGSTWSRYWDKVRCSFGRPAMDFYELRHFCATHLLEIGVSHSDVAVQLGHLDGGALVMSTYGHPSEVAARQRVRAALDGAQVGDLAKRRRAAG